MESVHVLEGICVQERTQGEVIWSRYWSIFPRTLLVFAENLHEHVFDIFQMKDNSTSPPPLYPIIIL